MKREYKRLLAVDSLAEMSSAESLRHIGDLVDLAFDLRQLAGLAQAIDLSKQLDPRELSDGETSTLHYCLANAWHDLRVLSTTQEGLIWGLHQEEVEKELFHLRLALRESRESTLPVEARCQILTNLANLFDEIGRCVEAIEYWDRALVLAPSFAMARGNRGIGLSYYGRSLYDPGHQGLFLRHAHRDLADALAFPAMLHEGAQASFEKHLGTLEHVLGDAAGQEFDMDFFPLGTSEEETAYRRWCLENRLFVNPLNDLGPHPIAARDILTTPSITTGIQEGPYYQGFFNQMKQEYVSARYLFYDGVSSQGSHFSDREVLLYNTLDYPAYSLAVEKVKAAFRVAYSVFDKVAFFVNEYLKLGISAKKVTFGTFWYTTQAKKKGLRLELGERRNWPLRGLFWLSRDLYEDKPGFRQSAEPDAQEIHDIRNHLEHKYLKLHDDPWIPSDQVGAAVRGLVDTLAFSIHRKDFEMKTLRLLRMIRAALIYLSLAIHCEEQQRAQKKGPNTMVAPMFMDTWQDEWKI